jgi:2,3-dimethylmalate lyase
MFKAQEMRYLFHSSLKAPGYIELLGCHDALSALIAFDAGFRNIFLSGYGVASAQYGYPDIELITQTETVKAAKQICSALNVPVIVDADTGYGGVDSVVRTLCELEAAGATGIVLEDQVTPKVCGHSKCKQVLPLPQFMRKLEAALKARQPGTVIIARTDSIDLSDAIARAKAFHAAGADILLIDGLPSLDAMKRVADEVPGNKQVNLIQGGKSPILSAEELHKKYGFKIVQYSTPTLYIMANAMQKALKLLHQAHDLRAVAEESVDLSYFQDFIMTHYNQRPEQASFSDRERAENYSLSFPKRAAS